MLQGSLPHGALTRNEDGVIVHDESKCIVCKMCVSACPLGNMAFSPRTRKVFKCDMCGGDPQCALFCPTGAILLVDPARYPKSNLPPTGSKQHGRGLT